jgi:hypothetical protein
MIDDETRKLHLPGCSLPHVHSSGCHALGEEERPDEASADMTVPPCNVGLEAFDYGNFMRMS